jgi:hypothetical protein
MGCHCQDLLAHNCISHGTMWKIGHTVLWLSIAARIIRRPHCPLQTRCFTHISGKTLVQNGYQTGTHLTNENSKFQFTCLHFHFSLQLTNTNHINNHSKFFLSCLFPCTTLHFFTISQRTGMVCPLECTALTSIMK